MVPHLDLLLLAFLHGSFISCVILVAIFLILITLLLACSLTVFSIVVIDVYTIFSLLPQYFQYMKADLELGFVFLLYTAMNSAISAISSAEPSFNRMVSSLKSKTQHARNKIDSLLFISTPRL
ncbi:hypothetical protein SLEP1_g52006 [Rubroshorea leprosula]|uniref:Uncharacterized protein n=1 Tax=Rubroshorea leprosula TaxID=152421 RepID=A0AAV5M5T2_9ROSI|nr:hypothetical protein SLEP1_g52006 [Rubroshorea leprosula]